MVLFTADGFAREREREIRRTAVNSTNTFANCHIANEKKLVVKLNSNSGRHLRFVQLVFSFQIIQLLNGFVFQGATRRKEN